MSAIEQDWRTAQLGQTREAMLAYAEKLTRTPSECTRDDVQSLRAAGFGDADILGLCEVVAYYAYANRIADGLGIELE